MEDRCHRCGKPVGDDTPTIGPFRFCPDCLREVDRAAAAEPEEGSDLERCARCGAVVPVEDLKAGAMKTDDGHVFCKRCVEIALPLFEALEGSSSVIAPSVEPASSVSGSSESSAPSVELASGITSSAYRTSRPEGGSSRMLWALCAAVASLVVVILAVALSGGSGGGSDDGGGRRKPLKDPVAEARRTVTEILKRVEIDQDFDGAYLDLRRRREEWRTRRGGQRVTPVFDWALSRLATLRGEAAEKEYRRLRKRAEELEAKERWKEAAGVVRSYPSKFQGAGEWWERIEEAAARYDDYDAAMRAWSDLKRQVEAALKTELSTDDFEKLTERMNEVKSTIEDTPYAERWEGLNQRLRQAFQKRLEALLDDLKAKAEALLKDRARTLEAVRTMLKRVLETRKVLEGTLRADELDRLLGRLKKAEKALAPCTEEDIERLLEKPPLVSVTLNVERPRANCVYRFKECYHPLDCILPDEGPEVRHRFTMPRKGESELTLEFTLAKVPTLAALAIHHELGGKRRIRFKIVVNGRESDKDVENDGPFPDAMVTAVPLKGLLKEGLNTVKVLYLDGTQDPDLSAVSVHIETDAEEEALIKRGIARSKEAVEKANRLFYQGHLKEMEKRRAKWSRGIGRKALPALPLNKKVSHT